MRVHLLLLLAFFAATNVLEAQTQQLSYEMKLLRVYQNYPHDDPGGPDITWKARALLNGLGPSPIAGPTVQVHLPDMQTTGWFDAGAQTIATGSMTYSAGNTFNLCTDNITVNLELEAWEEDCGDVFDFQNFCDIHRFGAAANGIGNARINFGSGATRVFALENFPANVFQNPYYKFEVSISYTLTNGIREVIYAGDVNGGPVADVCAGGSYYLFARTAPGFTGGDFQFQRSDNNGSTWTTVQTGNSPAYLVTATTNTAVLYRVRLRGGFSCLGYTNDDGWMMPAGPGNLRIIPTFGAADVNYSIQSSCAGDANSSISVNSITNLPLGTVVSMQLNAPDDPFFVSPDPGFVSLPYTWTDLEPGRYTLNVTGVQISGENLPTGQCTQDVLIEIAPVTVPEFTSVAADNPGCEETTGSVSATISTFNAAFPHSWEVFAAGTTTTPVATSTTQASTVQIDNLVPGTYYVRLTLDGECVVESNAFTIATPPVSAGGSVQISYPSAANNVLCPDGRATVNLMAAANTGTNTVRVFLASNLNNQLISGVSSPGSPFITLLTPNDYTAIFQRNDNGCQAFVNFTVANPNNVLTATVAATQTPAACTPLGGSVTLSVTGGAPPYSFIINGMARIPSTTSGNNRVFNQLASGVGTYEITDATGCSTGIAYFSIGRPAFPLLSITFKTDDFMICNEVQQMDFLPITTNGWQNGSTYQIRVDPLQNTYGPPVPPRLVNNNTYFEPNIFAENLPPGAHTIYFRENPSGCEVARSVVVEQLPEMLITKVEAAPVYCGQTSTTIKIYASGILTRTINNQTWESRVRYDLLGNNTWSSTNMEIDPSAPNSIVITIPNANVSTNRTFRVQQSIGRVFGSPTGFFPNLYCSTPDYPFPTSNFNIAPPVAVTTQLNSPTCPGETNGSITVNFTGGEPGYELQLVRFGSTNPPANPTVIQTVLVNGSTPNTYTFNGLAPGSYGVSVRTAIIDGGNSNLPGSCTRYFPGNWTTGAFFAPYTLTNPAPITINTINTTTPLQCDLTGGQITVQSVTGGTPPYRYSVNGVDFSTSNVLPALGQNTVYVRDARGCQATRTYNVTQVITPSLAINFAATPPANCVLEGLGTFTITPGTPPYQVAYAASRSGGELVNPIILQTSDLSLAVSGLAPGSLFVDITDAAKCSRSFSFTVPSVSSSPLAASTALKTQQSCPNINNGALTILVQGGTPPFQIVYNGISTVGASRSLTNLGPGSYLFDITDAAGCTYVHEESIEAATVIRHNQSFTAVGPCVDSGNGSVTISPVGGVPPYTISWQDGTPGQTVGAGGTFTRSNLDRQEYIFTITGAGAGCSLVSSIYPPGPDVPFAASIGSVAQPQCAGVEDGAVTIQASGGTEPYTFSADGGTTFQSSSILVGFGAGTYSLIARDALGCERIIDNVLIENVQQVSAAISTSAINCFGENTGSITVTPSGGTAPYFLSVNGSLPSTNLTANNLPAGTYAIEVTDADGCPFTESAVVITQPAALSLLATPTPPACGGSTGSISLSAAGGSGVYEYRLVGGIYGTNSVLSDLAVGNYDVQVRDANGCETTVLNVVVPGPEPIVIELQSSRADYCERADGAATVTATGGSGNLSYAWSNGDTGPTATGLAAGTATVTVTDQSNCSNTLVVTILAIAGPSISGIVVQDAVCTDNNGQATLSFAGGTGVVSVSWSNGASGTTITGLSAGNYTASVTDAEGCIAVQTISVGFTAPHTLTTTQTDENCDQGNGAITVNANGGSGNFTYAWPAGVTANGNTAQNLAGGLYEITVTDNIQGCVVTTSVTLNNSAALSANLDVANVLCNGQAGGSITAIPLTGSAPFTLSINGAAPSTVLTASGLTAGTYAIVISDANGCTFSNPTVVVSEPAALTLGATPTMPSCFGVDDATILLSANGGTGGYEYRLVGGTYSTNAILTNLSAGTYAVQVRDGNGCETTLNDVIITSPDPVMIQLEASTPEFCDRADGTATVSASGGLGSLIFTWSDGQSGPTATGLTAGTYSVTVEDASGCTASLQNISISATPAVALSIVEVIDSRCEQGNGQITVAATGAPGPFTYSWSHAPGLNSPIATALNSGTYSLTVTDANNCSAQITATVLLRPRPVLDLPIITLAACMGNTGTMQVTVASGGTPPFTYEWSHDLGLNASLAPNLTSGNYTCTVTDFYGCTAEVTAFVGELPPPVAAVVVTTATCTLPNGRAQVSVLGGTPPYQYAWSNGAPNNPVAQNLATGDYTVTVTDFYGCTAVENFNVSNVPGPAELVVNFQNSLCSNGLGSITVTPQGGTPPFDYTWSHNAFLNQPTAVLLNAGTYFVTATDANGCEISTSQVIELLPTPTITVLTRTNSRCTNGNGLIELAVTGTGPFTYAWTNNVSTGPLAQNLNVGNYTVTVTDVTSNCTATRSFNIALEPAPAIQLTQLTNDICGQGIGAIRLNAIGGTQPLTFSWSHAPNLNSNVATGLIAGTYSVTLSDANNCSTTAQYTVGGIAGPTIQLQNTTTAFCGNAVGGIVVQVTGGLMPYTYTWSHNPGLNSPAANNLLPGSYSVTVTDANNCPATLQAEVLGTELPVLSLVSTFEDPCVAQDVVIEMAINGGQPPFEFTWSHDPNLNSLVTGTLPTGTYTLTATDANGCMATLSTSVTDFKSPELSLEDVTTSRCNANEGSIQVSAEFGLLPYTYTWSHTTGLNANTATGLAPGQYTVTVTDANGCTDQLSATIIELPPPSAVVTSTTATCSLPNGSAQVSVSGGTPPYQYSWSNGASDSPTAQNLAGGDYTVTVTDFFGCQDVQNFNVSNVPGPAELVIDFQDSRCTNGTGSITVSPQGGTPPFGYSWSHNAALNQPTAQLLEAGTYSVTATDANGCEISITQVIEFLPPPNLVLVVQANSFCTDGTGLIQVATLGTGPFSYAWTNGVSTGPLAQNLSAGNYTVTVTDETTNCTSSLSFTIELEPAPELELVEITNDICEQGVGAIRINPLGGAQPITYSWTHAPNLNSPNATGLTAGVYGVTIRDNNGCTAFEEYTINDVQGPTVVLQNVSTDFCGNAVGAVTVLAQGGQSPYQYSWAHNQNLNSPTAANLSSGDYTVTVTDANNCSAILQVNVPGTEPPVLSLVQVNENPCVVNDATITIGLVGNSPPYTYSWSHNPALNSLVATGLSTGTYTITATDVNGCEETLTTSVIDRRGPILAVVSTNNSSCGQLDGSATVAASLGQLPYTYSWSHDLTLNSPTASNLAAGAYSVSVNDANGCTAQVSFNLSDLEGPSLLIADQQDAICTPDNGSVSVTASGGQVPYTFTWSHNPGLNNSNATGLAPGNYTITVTDLNGCRAITSTTVGFQAPPSLNTIVNQALCEPTAGSALVQVSGGVEPFQINWNTPGVVGFNPMQLAAGNYSATVTDGNGCNSTTQFTIDFIAGPALNLVEVVNPDCSEGTSSISVEAVGGVAPFSYSWSHNATINAPIATGLEAGFYTVTVTDFNGCEATLTQELIFSDSPDLVLTQINNSTCTDDNGTLSFTVTSSVEIVEYDWSHTDTLNGPTATGLATGLYSLTVADINGCVSVQSAQVLFEAPPQLTLTNQTNAYCGNNAGSLSFTVAGGTGPYSFAWEHDATLTTPSASNLTPGLYTLSVTDAFGCSSTNSVQILNEPAFELPDPMVQPSSCAAADGTISFSAWADAPNYSFAWEHDATLSGPLATNLAAGFYNLTVTDLAGCQRSITIEVPNASSPEIVVADAQNPSCGEANGSINTVVSGGQAPYFFQWADGSNEPNRTNLSAGTYFLTVTDANDCQALLSVTLDESTAPLLQLAETIPSGCAIASGSLLFTATGGQTPYTFTWSHDADLNSNSASDLLAGNYSITLTDALGCSTTATGTVESTEGLVIELVNLQNATCAAANGSAEVNVLGGQSPYTFAWAHDPNLTTGTANGLLPGNYTVTVTDANGCTAERTVTIGDSPEIVVAIEVTATTCADQNDGSLTATVVSGGVAPFSFSWAGGQSGPMLNNLSAGSYALTVTDGNGCAVSANAEVTAPLPLTISLVSLENPPCTTASGGSISVQVSGGTADYQYEWSTGQQTATINGLDAGAYQLTVSDANGCQAAFEATLTPAENLEVSVVTQPQSCQGTNDGQATVNTVGPGPFSYTWNTPNGTNTNSLTNLPPGNYMVTVVNAAGCSAVQEFMIQPALPIEITTSFTPACLNELNGTATALASGGAGSFTYTWSDAQTGTLVTNLAPGIFSVTATDANACSSTAMVVVPAAPFPTVNLIATTQPNCTLENSGSIEVAATGGVGSIQYQWDDPLNQTGPIAIDLGPGTYTVVALDENGCSSALSANLVTPPNFLLSVATTANPTCFGAATGSAVAIAQGGSGNFSYAWDDPQGQTGPQASNLAAGSYNVTITDLISGCVQTSTATITEPPLLEIIALGTTDVACATQPTGSATVQANGGTGGYTFQWNDPALQTAATANNLVAGTYGVTVTDANGCTAQLELSIEEPPLLNSILETVSAPLCAGQNNGLATVITTGGTGNYTYQWDDPLMQTTNTATDLVAGNYNVLISDANGCQVNLPVLVPTTPAIEIALNASDDPSCAGTSDGSISVSATGGTGVLNYLWDNGVTQPMLTNLPAGSYAVSVTDENECTTSLLVTLAPSEAIDLATLVLEAPLCANEASGLITVAASGGGDLPFTYSWSNGATGPSISQISGGQTYQVTATNSANCSQQLAIDLPAGSAVDISAIPTDETICADDIFVLDLADFSSASVTGPDAFSETGNRVLLENTGTYTIAVQNQDGCRDTVDLSLLVTTDLLVAAMVLPSDVVVNDSVVVLETSWPAPESVNWVYDESIATLVRQEQNQYWFVFTEPGRTQLSLLATQGGCEDLVTKEIVVHPDSTSIPSVYLGPLEILSSTVSPNPNNGLFQAVVTLSSPGTLFMSLYTTSGVLVDRRQGAGSTSYTFDFDVQGQADTYLLLIQTGQDRRTTTVIVIE